MRVLTQHLRQEVATTLITGYQCARPSAVLSLHNRLRKWGGFFLPFPILILWSSEREIMRMSQGKLRCKAQFAQSLNIFGPSILLSRDTSRQVCLRKTPPRLASPPVRSSVRLSREAFPQVLLRNRHPRSASPSSSAASFPPPTLRKHPLFAASFFAQV